jgi:hypothetical protein
MAQSVSPALRRAAVALAIGTLVLLGAPSGAHAYWYNGVWIEPGPVAPYPYAYPYGYRPPPPVYGPGPGRREWVERRWDGYRWAPGYWRYY